MKNINTVSRLAICFLCLSGCGHDTSTQNNSSLGHELDEGEIFDQRQSIKLYRVEDNEYVMFDTLKFKVPPDANITPTNIYNGVYEMTSDSLERRKWLIDKDWVFLTTIEDLGKGVRSFLYVFDISHRSIIRDSVFKRCYVFSSAGIFIIDTVNNKIFSVNIPSWYDSKKEMIIPASLLDIKGGYFNYIKNVYEVGDEIPRDTALVSFFKNTILTGSNSVTILPNDWWKVH